MSALLALLITHNPAQRDPSGGNVLGQCTCYACKSSGIRSYALPRTKWASCTGANNNIRQGGVFSRSPAGLVFSSITYKDRLRGVYIEGAGRRSAGRARDSVVTSKQQAQQKLHRPCICTGEVTARSRHTELILSLKTYRRYCCLVTRVCRPRAAARPFVALHRETLLYIHYTSTQSRTPACPCECSRTRTRVTREGQPSAVRDPVRQVLDYYRCTRVNTYMRAETSGLGRISPSVCHVMIPSGERVGP